MWFGDPEGLQRPPQCSQQYVIFLSLSLTSHGTTGSNKKESQSQPQCQTRGPLDLPAERPQVPRDQGDRSPEARETGARAGGHQGLQAAEQRQEGDPSSSCFVCMSKKHKELFVKLPLQAPFTQRPRGGRGGLLCCTLRPCPGSRVLLARGSGCPASPLPCPLPRPQQWVKSPLQAQNPSSTPSSPLDTLQSSSQPEQGPDSIP